MARKDIINTDGSIKWDIIGSFTEQLADKTKKIDNLSIVSAKDFNMLGDGVTNDSVELQKAFDAAQGKILVLEKDKVYGIPNGTVVNIKDNTTVISNGAKFKKTTAGSTFTVTILGNNVNIDALRYVPYQDPNECGVRILGNNIEIGLFETLAETPGCGGASTSRNALFIKGSNIRIRKVITKNWERPVQLLESSYLLVDHFDIETFLQGVYVSEVKHSRFPSAHIRGISPNADGKAGQNGLLIEAKTNNGTQNLRFENWLVEDTGEHGYRIGGQSIVTDIYHVNCISRRPGRGELGDPNIPSEYGIGHGGCGFKVLGPTDSAVERHRNIHYIDCVAEDGRTNVPITRTNFAGFQIGKCINVTLANPIVRTNGINVSDRSFVNGIEIIGTEEMTISNPSIGYTFNNGIHIYDADPALAGGDFGSLLSRININGGIILNPVNAGIYISANKYTFRRINIINITLDTGSASYCIQTVKSSTGAISGCYASGYVNPINASAVLSGSIDWLVDLSGNFGAGTNDCADGSTFKGNGLFKLRKAGAWATL